MKHPLLFPSMFHLSIIRFVFYIDKNDNQPIENHNRELFLWAVVLNRRELAHLFWQAGKDQIGRLKACSRKIKSIIFVWTDGRDCYVFIQMWLSKISDFVLLSELFCFRERGLMLLVYVGTKVNVTNNGFSNIFLNNLLSF